MVILVQLVFFIIHAVSVGHTRHVLSYVGKGMLLGLPFGVVFDLLIGQYFGIYNNLLGFGFLFLTINGIFSYGLMIANVMLLQHHSLHHMYFWSIGLALVYEAVNYYYPVWEWTFGTPLVEYAVVILVAYCGLATLMMCALRTVYRVQFKSVSVFM
jgi:hypothetical protein